MSQSYLTASVTVNIMALVAAPSNLFLTTVLATARYATFVACPDFFEIAVASTKSIPAEELCLPHAVAEPVLLPVCLLGRQSGRLRLEAAELR